MIYTCVSDTKTQPCCVSLHIYVCVVGFCFHFLRLFIAFASAFLIHVIKTIGWFFYPDISIEIKFNSVIFLTINWYWTTSNWKIICELVAYYRLTQLYMRTHTHVQNPNEDIFHFVQKLLIISNENILHEARKIAQFRSLKYSYSLYILFIWLALDVWNAHNFISIC